MLSLVNKQTVWTLSHWNPLNRWPLVEIKCFSTFLVRLILEFNLVNSFENKALELRERNNALVYNMSGLGSRGKSLTEKCFAFTCVSRVLSIWNVQCLNIEQKCLYSNQKSDNFSIWTQTLSFLYRGIILDQFLVKKFICLTQAIYVILCSERKRTALLCSEPFSGELKMCDTIDTRNGMYCHWLDQKQSCFAETAQ